MEQFVRELQQKLDMAINEKHAPILIPRTTIDAAHTQINSATANTTWTNQNWVNTASSLSASVQTALTYTGRGVLRLCAVTEKASGGTAAFNAELKITIDGNVVYDDAACLNREQSYRVVLGQYIDTTGGGMFLDDPIGLPFNATCKIEYKSDGTRTVTVGYRVSKKL